MKKSLLAAASAITILASGSVSAQTSMNGPYYASPSWDQTLPATQRFIVLSNMNNEAVLDRETGLVWQRTPGTSFAPTWRWDQAQDACHMLGGVSTMPTTTGRLGWRLPSLEELGSLVDLTQANPALPPGHPFLGVENVPYWTATSNQAETGLDGFSVNFATGTIDFTPKETTFNHIWCVRSSHVAPPQ
jgi:hypothetical protein